MNRRLVFIVLLLIPVSAAASGYELESDEIYRLHSSKNIYCGEIGGKWNVGALDETGLFYPHNQTIKELRAAGQKGQANILARELANFKMKCKKPKTPARVAGLGLEGENGRCKLVGLYEGGDTKLIKRFGANASTIDLYQGAGRCVLFQSEKRLNLESGAADQTNGCSFFDYCVDEKKFTCIEPEDLVIIQGAIFDAEGAFYYNTPLTSPKRLRKYRNGLVSNIFEGSLSNYHSYQVFPDGRVLFTIEEGSKTALYTPGASELEYFTDNYQRLDVPSYYAIYADGNIYLSEWIRGDQTSPAGSFVSLIRRYLSLEDVFDSKPWMAPAEFNPYNVTGDREFLGTIPAQNHTNLNGRTFALVNSIVQLYPTYAPVQLQGNFTQFSDLFGAENYLFFGGIKDGKSGVGIYNYVTGAETFINSAYYPFTFDHSKREVVFFSQPEEGKRFIVRFNIDNGLSKKRATELEAALYLSK